MIHILDRILSSNFSLYRFSVVRSLLTSEGKAGLLSKKNPRYKVKIFSDRKRSTKFNQFQIDHCDRIRRTNRLIVYAYNFIQKPN